MRDWGHLDPAVGGRARGGDGLRAGPLTILPTPLPAAISPSSSSTTCTVGSGITESPGSAYGWEKCRGRCDVYEM